MSPVAEVLGTNTCLTARCMLRRHSSTCCQAASNAPANRGNSSGTCPGVHVMLPIASLSFPLTLYFLRNLPHGDQAASPLQVAPRAADDDAPALSPGVKGPPTLPWRVAAALTYLIPWIDSLTLGKEIYHAFPSTILLYFIPGRVEACKVLHCHPVNTLQQ